MQISLPGFIRQMIYVAWSENVTAGLSRLYIAFLGKDFLNFYLRQHNSLQENVFIRRELGMIYLL